VSKSTHINLAQPGLADAIRSPRAMGLWEVLRRHRRAATASQVAALCQCSHAEAQQDLDLLERATLVRKRRASRGRRSAAYEVALQSISVVFDRGDPGHAKLVRILEQYVTNDLEDEHFRHEIPITSASSGHWRYYHCNPLYLEASDLEELKRRIARVEEFVKLLNDRQSASTSTSRCNHAMAIRISPLGGNVMPQPHVKLVSRNVAEAPRRTAASPAQRLSRREREAVLALRDGKSRAAVAKHLGISVHTLGTVCKRAYRKLGINRVSQLRDVSID
jgi:DNA-binding CsgD family transcriptional regulator